MKRACMYIFPNTEMSPRKKTSFPRVFIALQFGVLLNIPSLILHFQTLKRTNSCLYLLARMFHYPLPSFSSTEFFMGNNLDASIREANPFSQYTVTLKNHCCNQKIKYMPIISSQAQLYKYVPCKKIQFCESKYPDSLPESQPHFKLDLLYLF